MELLNEVAAVVACFDSYSSWYCDRLSWSCYCGALDRYRVGSVYFHWDHLLLFETLKDRSAANEEAKGLA